jgi:hypothetical protein
MPLDAPTDGLASDGTDVSSGAGTSAEPRLHTLINHQLVAVFKHTPAECMWGALLDALDPAQLSTLCEAAGDDWPAAEAALEDESVRSSPVSFLVQISVSIMVVGLREEKKLAYRVARTGSWPRLQEAFSAGV